MVSKLTKILERQAIKLVNSDFFYKSLFSNILINSLIVWCQEIVF